MTNVVIVAGNPLSGESIRRALAQVMMCRVVVCVDGRIACATAIARVRPDLVLIDDLPVPRARLMRIREARSAAPGAKILLLTGRMEASGLADAAAAGIDAAIAKQLDPVSFGTLIREVSAGNVFHAFAPMPASAPAMRDGLTPRELEILRLVAAGASNGRIARTLWVAEQTVKYHLSNIYRKLGVANRTQASHYAHMHRLLDSPAAPVAVAHPPAEAAA
jgi:DNA-binding NarL/FixJ family response regulator